MAAQPSGAIWALRHGERADAADPAWEATAKRPHDPPLTRLGRLQAAATADALAAERIDAVYSSPFLRCIQTAAAIAAPLGLFVRIEPGLSEFLNPRWFERDPVDEGMSLEAIRAQRAFDGSRIELEMACGFDESYVPVYDTAARRGGRGALGALGAPAALAYPETVPDAIARYARTLRAVQESQPFALLVTHGFGVQAIAESCGGVEVSECDYCSLTRLRLAARPEGGPAAAWKCDVLCRTTHTAELAAGAVHDASAVGAPAGA